MMKKKHLFHFFFLLIFALNVSAQTATQIAKQDPVEQRLRVYVNYLASDKLEGRRTGEKGATFSAGYISNLFSKFKLKPGTTSAKKRTNYLQSFPYVTGVELGKNNEFHLDITKLDGERMRFTNMLPVRVLGASPNSVVEDSPVVFAGFGITAQDRAFDDYKNIDVKNKTVLAFDGNPEYKDPKSSFSRFSIYTKAKLAKDNGARALLLISLENNFDDEKLTKLTYDPTLGELAIPTFIISRNTAANMLGTSEDRLNDFAMFASMKKDSPGAQINFPAIPNSVISFKVDVVKKKAEAYNVVGTIDGTDPILKNEAIVIGAHYDHLGFGGQGSLAINSKEIHHGADDNASGTAALIELAKYFSSVRKNKRTLIFIAFSGEEEGLLGSKFYVNNPVAPLEKTIAMINMDMIGRLRENKLTVGGIGTASEWRTMITPQKFVPVSLEAMKPAGAMLNLQLSEDGFGPSDHSSFYGKQIPVLFFFTGSHEDYHKPSDTSEKINFAGLQMVMNLVKGLVVEIDSTEKRPTYTVAKSSGGGDGRRSFAVTLGVVPGYGDSNDGMLLDGVRDGGAASQAGLKAGDKIIKLAGKDVRNVSDYTTILGELKADVEYEVVVIRGKEQLTLKVKPAARK